MQIRKVIDDHHESLVSVAKKCGKTSSAIIQIADGNPTVKKLKELADAIGCHWLDFFADELEADGLKVVKADAEPVEEEQQPQTEDDVLPFDNEQEEQRAEEVRVARFQYDCPHCGKGVRLSIEQV